MALIRFLFIGCVIFVSLGASYRTPHFMVEASSTELAKEIAEPAEKLYARAVAQWWDGRLYPHDICLIRVAERTDGLTLKATVSWIPDRQGAPRDILMNVQGPVKDLIGTVLPHEVTHIVIAARFRALLPRWLEEGPVMIDEAGEELASRVRNQALYGNRRSLTEILSLSRYPTDTVKLTYFYNEAGALCQWLLDTHGREKFIELMSRVAGSRYADWPVVFREVYGYQSVEAVEDAWHQSLRGHRRSEPPDQLVDVADLRL